MRTDRCRLIQAFFLPGAEELRGSAWSPVADVYQGPEGWLVKVDLAGVRPEDVQVTVSGTRLMVCGLRRDWAIGQSYSHYSMEIAYHRFERTFEFPCDLAHARLTTDYRDGMLLIHIICGAVES